MAVQKKAVNEASKVEFNAGKFKELVLYVADRSLDDRYFGATKLNKLLFYADFIAYRDYGKPITGATYEKRDFGPVPREMTSIRSSLRKEKAAEVVKNYELHFGQKRLLPLRRADLDAFSANEIALVDRIIEMFRFRSAGDVSAFSHRAPGWQIAGDREEIPYFTAFISVQAPTEKDIRRGQELAARHGWGKAAA
jgi:uncharacterized phage-associated protein